MFSIKKNIYVLYLSIFVSNLFAQTNNSIEVSGGFIFPMSSTNGLIGNIQFNYPLTDDFYLYIYTGYSEWDKFKISIDYRYSEIESTINNQKRFIPSYSANSHIKIPLYLGTRLNFRTNKLFTSFINFEFGYSYLSYNSYDKWNPVYSNSGEVINYIPEEATKEKNTEYLFGIAIGLGASIPISKDLNVILNYKVNSSTNFKYIEMLSIRGTNSMLVGGVNFII
ncbi:MAG: hypothetical protein IPM32_15550 [Ignavibacteriae bacterium]|nr:hypothetical protein [Ignavibacteriota bacterium]